MRLFPRFAALAILIPCFTFAQEAPPKPDEPKPAEKKEEKKEDDKPKERTGAAMIAGAEVKYATLTGQLPIFKEDGALRASVFYVYYAAVDKDGKRLAVVSAPSGKWGPCCSVAPSGTMTGAFAATAAATSGQVISSNNGISR